MKKIVLFLLLNTIILSVFSVSANSQIYDAKNCTVKLGNSNVDLQGKMFFMDNRLFVPLRRICDELRIPITWDDKTQEAKMDIYKKEIEVSDGTQLKEEGVIPDEETALAVGKLLLEKYAGRELEYETEKRTYYLRAVYIEEECAWIVVQNFVYKNPNAFGSTDFSKFPTIKLSRKTGEVLYINTVATHTN